MNESVRACAFVVLGVRTCGSNPTDAARTQLSMSEVNMNVSVNVRVEVCAFVLFSACDCV